MKSQPVDWEKKFSPGVKKLPLPTYAFNAKRHWPKYEIEKDEDETDRLANLFYSVEWQQEQLAESLLKEETKETNSKGYWVIFPPAPQLSMILSFNTVQIKASTASKSTQAINLKNVKPINLLLFRCPKMITQS